MKKILYIRIDNAPVPQVLKDEIEEFDCRQINDFCSFVGYAITENLKNSDGTPYYRIIRPVGQLLMNFKIENVGQFDAIMSQWTDLLGDILHKGVSENNSYAIRFPQEYIDWLCQNENEHYSYIGNNLKRNGSIVTLDTQELIEDVISSLRFKIEGYLQTNKNEFDYIVFSNPCIGNVSEVVKRLNDVFGNFSFLKLDQLADVYEYEKYRGHEYVDLGLPSGLKWATCNIGALKPSDYGDYYAWGETFIKESYHCGNCLTQFWNECDICKDVQYDVARNKWRGTWRLPTIDEIDELLYMCKWKWVKQNDHNGHLITGPNGRTIFLPASGVYEDSLLKEVGEWGYYWGATCGEGVIGHADSLVISNREYHGHAHNRSDGCTVRPVSE